ncbi:MAG: sulfotransferase [Pseudomonadota bacterium]
MAGKQTFILGIGCQKAGTTWLWDYLNSIDEITFTQPKELHVFDAMLRPELHAQFLFKARVQHLSRTPLQKLRHKLGWYEPGFVRAKQRIEMIANPQAYVEYFRSLDPSAKAVGEITPSYATLNASHFRFIRELLEPHFNLRVVLLLRDPVHRAFSAAKHLIRGYKRNFPIALGSDPNEFLESILETSYILERQDYERLLLSLDEAFEPGQVHVEFYERLFTDEAVRSLTEFVGVEAKKADFAKQVNAGLQTSSLDPKMAKRAGEIYSGTYEYCRQRFGAELIDKIWLTT